MLNSLFNIELYSNFINKMLQSRCFLVNIAEFLRSPFLKTLLRTPASIRCYFNTINLKQSGFYTTYFLKFLFHNENIKIISKIVNRKNKTKKIYNSFLTYNVYVMFYYKIPWFYQDFKSENLCFF